MIIDSREETRFISDVFARAQVSPDDAAELARSLTEANLRGVDSHGIIRVPVYFDRIRAGLVNRAAQLTVEADTPSLCVCDGQNGLGQILGRKAMLLAIEKARKTGIGMVAVRNSNHFGVTAEYSMLASEQGLFGIAMSNATPLMAPTGGLGKVIGNNPLSLSFPSDEKPDITVDMAMTTVAYGKLLVKQSSGQSVPYGWGVDKNGADTTDPSEIINGGYMLPVGGPKGYGLALAVEILTGVLTGGAVCKGVKSLNKPEPASISHTFLAIDYRQVCPEEQYQQRLSAAVADLRSCALIPGTKKIYMPGEIENECRNARLQSGITISDALFAELNTLAEQQGIEKLHAKA